MSKLEAVIAGALSILVLSSCGAREPAAEQNSAVAAEANALESKSPDDSAQPGSPANSLGDTVPPPDAVSHPNGYLPPAPAEPDPPAANSTGADPSPPATEDQYIRNGQ
jgi:hypothetical protein